VGEVHCNNNVVVYRCPYHLVWCPKYRHDVIDGKVDARTTPDGPLW